MKRPPLYFHIAVICALPLWCACGEEGSPDIPGAAADVDRARYLADLNKIAAQPRPPGSAHHLTVQTMCKTRLEQLGFTVELHNYGTGTNVVGKLRGGGAPAEEVIISAHYDGTKGCTGADDNGTGVAGALESARVLAAAGALRRTLTVACWDEEERSLLGSIEYIKKAKLRGDTIIDGYVYEMIGYYSDAPKSQTFPAGFDAVSPDLFAKQQANQDRGDFILVVHDVDDGGHSKAAAAEMARIAGEVGLKLYRINFDEAVKRSALAYGLLRSDHAAFYLQDYPAMMITDTANFRNPNYHCGSGQDTPDTLDHDFAVKVIQATVGAAWKQLQGGL